MNGNRAVYARFLTVLIGLVVGFQTAAPVYAQDIAPSTEIKKLTIVSIPGFSFRELEPEILNQLPNFKKITEHGALAAMNVRTPVKGLEDSYITFGSGTPALSEAIVQAEQWPNRNEAEVSDEAVKSPEDYGRYVGMPPEAGSLFVPGIRRIDALNDDQAYGAIPGALGGALRSHGVHTAVFGNLDAGIGEDAGHKRYAPLMLMDEGGEVESGNIGSGLLLPDDGYAYRVRTNYEKLFALWQQVKQPSVVCIELGDYYRLYEEKKWYDTARFSSQKMKVLQDMDSFIGKLTADIDKTAATNEAKSGGQELWVLSPLVNNDAMQEKSMFSPLIQYPYGPEAGFLDSKTTRRTGIAANIDIAPSVLAEFGIPAPVQMTGQALTVKARGNSIETADEDVLAYLLNMVDGAKKVYILRPQILYSLVSYEICVLLTALLAVLFKWKRRQWLSFALLSIMAAPAGLLLIGYAVDAPVEWIVGILLVFIALGSLLLSRMRLIPALIAAGFINGFAILFDGLSGSYGMQHSVLGYDAMIGARYYGIGNEFMGVVIGAFILGFGALLQWMEQKGADQQKWRMKWLLALLSVLIAIYMGFPTLGTNAGGAITAVSGFGLFWIRVYGGGRLKEFKWKPFIMIMLALFVIAFVVLFVLNALIGGGHAQQSHIGRAFDLLLEGKLQMIGLIMLRKLEMNLHLIGVSSWSKVLITSLLVMAVLIMRPYGVFRRWQNRIPTLMYAFSAIAVGSIVTLVFNDSGIVAASTMIVFTAVPLLLIKLQE